MGWRDTEAIFTRLGTPPDYHNVDDPVARERDRALTAEVQGAAAQGDALMSSLTGKITNLLTREADPEADAVQTACITFEKPALQTALSTIQVAITGADTTLDRAPKLFAASSLEAYAVAVQLYDYVRALRPMYDEMVAVTGEGWAGLPAYNQTTCDNTLARMNAVSAEVQVQSDRLA